MTSFRLGESRVGVTGAFTFVLHSHIPYARLAGRWPHGEEWLHEAASETYIPLLQTLYQLHQQHLPIKLTIGLTPVLCEQLADETVLENLVAYLDAKIEAATRDMQQYNQQTDDDSEHMAMLAQWYQEWYSSIKETFITQFNRDIIGAFRHLQDEGVIEIITSAATHAYLPLLARDTSIRAQIRAAKASYERYFGRAPRAIWLPECAYRPAYVTDEGKTRVGLETMLAEEGLRLFFSETHTITGGQPVGTASGDVIGPYGMVKRRYVVPTTTSMPQRTASTYQPYYVSESVAGAAGKNSGVIVIGRNSDTGQQVWSSQIGYPGDFDYREFYKKSGTSGLPYWRVSGDEVELGAKDYYKPDWAAFKTDQHAEHFAHMVGDLLRQYHKKTGKYGIITSSYDTELFGHWWFEGVSWLGKVLRHLADDPEVELVTASDFVESHPPDETLHLPESSWGMGGAHFNWDNNETRWMWQPIHDCEGRMAYLANRIQKPTDDERVVLNQAARELMLMQSSDWQFLVTTGQAREYAAGRFSQHVERFRRLAESLDIGQPNRALAEEFWKIDKVFPDIDYQWYIDASS
jgi:1,4-alpha-glucan branching enzyme